MSDSNEDFRECTCDELAHPCDIHDTSGPPETVRGPEWKPSLALRVGHLKLGRWLKALSEGGCLACPDESSGNVGCLTCPGNRQDCECYEHQGEGPDDDQLRELIEMRDTQDRINAMLKTQAEIRDAHGITYLTGQSVILGEGYDSEEEPCTHEIVHMNRCAGCSALWNGEDEEWIEEKKSVLSTKMSDMELELKSGGGFNAKLMLVDDPGPSVGWITEEEDYRLEKDPIERLRKKNALFSKVYGMDAPVDVRSTVNHELIEAYEKAKTEMLGEKAEKKQKEEKAEEFADLPPGNYWVKRGENGALTQPISVSPQGVEWLKTLPQGAMPKTDPIAQAQMAAYATVKGKAFQEEGLEKDEEEKGKKKWNLSRGMRRLLKKRVLRKKAS